MLAIVYARILLVGAKIGKGAELTLQVFLGDAVRPAMTDAAAVEVGSPGRIRTYNLAVNSRPLYR
jgi:hypothetical protein